MQKASFNSARIVVPILAQSISVEREEAFVFMLIAKLKWREGDLKIVCL